MNDFETFFKDKTILITWWVGTIGSNLLAKLSEIKSIKKIRIFDNRETELFFMQQLTKNPNDKIRFLFWDIRDKNRLKRAMAWADIVFHTAALKHVPNCEYNPMDAIYTNIIGTQNLIEVALDLDIEKVTYISTDKAVNPTTVMGATKLLWERLIHSMYLYKWSNKTNFSAVRFGNVFNSRWSVIDLWEKQVQEWQKITVTHPDMTRFFIKTEDAADLVLTSTVYWGNWSIFILKMDAIRIRDLAEVFLETKWLSINDIIITWGRPWEKLHEELILEWEEDLLYENDKMFVKIFKAWLEVDGFKKSDIKKFSSKDYLLNKQQIKDLFFTK